MKKAHLVAACLATLLLSGCVVAPVGYRPYATYPDASVYVETAPVVVVPAPYYGYRGYRGYRHWR